MEKQAYPSIYKRVKLIKTIKKKPGKPKQAAMQAHTPT